MIPKAEAARREASPRRAPQVRHDALTCAAKSHAPLRARRVRHEPQGSVPVHPGQNTGAGRNKARLEGTALDERRHGAQLAKRGAEFLRP